MRGANLRPGRAHIRTGAALLLLFAAPVLAFSQRSQGRQEADRLAAYLLRAAPRNRKEVAAFLKCHRGLLSHAVGGRLADECAEDVDRSYENDELQRPLLVCGLAADLAVQIHDDGLLAAAEYWSGQAYLHKGQDNAAAGCFRKSVAHAQKAQDWRLYTHALGVLAELEGRDRHPHEAKEAAARCVRVSELVRGLFGVECEPGHALALYTLGLLASGEGDEQASARLMEDALHRLIEIDKQDPRYGPVVFTCLLWLGNSYEALGDYSHALDFYARALAFARLISYRDGLEQSLDGMALIYIEQADYGKATALLDEYLDTARRNGDRRGAAIALTNLGYVHERSGEYGDAKRCFIAALATAEDTHDGWALVHIRQGLGAVYQDQGDLSAALTEYNKGFVVAAIISYKTGQFETVWREADAFLALGDYARCAQMSSAALALSRELGDVDYSYLALTLRGKAYVGLGRYDDAQKDLLLATERADLLRSHAGGQEQEAAYLFERKIEPFYLMVDLLARQHKDEQALLFAERARSRALLDLLGGARNDLDQVLTPAERDAERKLSGALTSANAELYKEQERSRSDRERIAALSAQVQRARFEYDSFLDRLYVEHPHLKASRGQMAPLSPATLDNILRSPDAAALEFEVLDDKTYAFAITRTTGPAQVHAYRIDIDRKALADEVHEFRQRIATAGLGVDSLSTALGQMLLGPVAEELAGKKVLLIIPDGVLWDLPFQALKLADERYLIQHCSVFYSPSLTALREMATRRGTDGDGGPGSGPVSGLLAFGNPSLSPGTSGRARSTERDESVGPLPAAEAEVRALSSLYGTAGSRVLVGAAATEEEAKAEMGHFRILHFATHGILDAKEPLYSHILLAQAPGGKEDGLLEAREIMNLNLRAELVVLSACQTARGRISSGEGVIGMAWAFFAAGCPTVVVSQWSVESESTSKLMIEFHKKLLAGMHTPEVTGTAEALREAELEMLQDPRYRHPFYWAGFVVVGDGW